MLRPLSAAESHGPTLFAYISRVVYVGDDMFHARRQIHIHVIWMV